MSDLSTRYRKMRSSRFLYRMGYGIVDIDMDYERMSYHWFRAMDNGGSYAKVNMLEDTVSEDITAIKSVDPRA